VDTTDIAQYQLADGTEQFKLERTNVTVQIAGHPAKYLRTPSFERWWKNEVAEQERQIEALKSH
jgi:hypothetical protein